MSARRRRQARLRCRNKLRLRRSRFIRMDPAIRQKLFWRRGGRKKNGECSFALRESQERFAAGGWLSSSREKCLGRNCFREDEVGVIDGSCRRLSVCCIADFQVGRRR